MKPLDNNEDGIQPLSKGEKEVLLYHAYLVDPEKTKVMFETIASSKAKSKLPKPPTSYDEINPKCIVHATEMKELDESVKAGNEQI